MNFEGYMTFKSPFKALNQDSFAFYLFTSRIDRLNTQLLVFLATVLEFVNAITAFSFTSKNLDLTSFLNKEFDEKCKSSCMILFTVSTLISF